MTRRGDNIPPVSAYAHWNEEAASMWYLENRYDMEHWDEEIDVDDFYERNVDEPDPFSEEFSTQQEAQAFYDQQDLHDTPETKPYEYGGKWYVEHYDEKAHQARKRH